MSAKDVEHFSHGTWDFHSLHLKSQFLELFFFVNPRKTNEWQAENSNQFEGDISDIS